MNLYLRIKLYLMRKLFGKGPVDTVIGPMARMLEDMAQVATYQDDLAKNLVIASDLAYAEAVRAGNITTGFSKLMS